MIICLFWLFKWLSNLWCKNCMTSSVSSTLLYLGLKFAYFPKHGFFTACFMKIIVISLQPCMIQWTQELFNLPNCLLFWNFNVMGINFKRTFWLLMQPSIAHHTASAFVLCRETSPGQGRGGLLGWWRTAWTQPTGEFYGLGRVRDGEGAWYVTGR